MMERFDRIVWLLVWAVIFECSSTSGTGGSALCPCAALGELSSSVSIPDGYGIGCAQHDVIHPGVRSECNDSSSIAAVCNASWCYVDAAECALASSVSWMSTRALSYETCGSLDPYNLYQLADDLRGSSLRTVWLSNTAGWKGSFCLEDGSCTGPLAALLQDVVNNTGSLLDVVALYTEANLSTDASAVYPAFVTRQIRESYGSSGDVFDACIIASGLGFVDLCIGAFAVTTQRLQETSLLHVYNEPLYLVTKDAEDDPSFVQNFEAAFHPIPSEIWVSFIVILLFFSMLTFFHEYFQGVLFSEVTLVQAIGMSLWDMVYSPFCRGSRLEVQNLGAKLNNMAISFWVLITVCTYVAALFAQFSNTKPVEAAVVVNGMADLISGGHSLCLEGSARADVQTLYPALANVIETSTPQLLGSLSASRCSAALVPLETLQAHQGRGEHCNLITRGQPVLYKSIAIAASDAAHRALGYQLSLSSAQWQRALDDSFPTAICSESEDLGDDLLGTGRRLLLEEQRSSAQSGFRRLVAISGASAVAPLVAMWPSDEGGERLPLSDMVGPIVLALAALLLGFIFGLPSCIIGCLSCFRTGRGEEALEDDGQQDGSDGSPGRSPTTQSWLRALSSKSPTSPRTSLHSNTSSRHSLSKAPGFEMAHLVGALHGHKMDLEQKLEKLSVFGLNHQWAVSSKKRSKEEGETTKLLLSDILKEVQKTSAAVSDHKEADQRGKLTYSAMGMIIG